MSLAHGLSPRPNSALPGEMLVQHQERVLQEKEEEEAEDEDEEQGWDIQGWVKASLRDGRSNSFNQLDLCPTCFLTLRRITDRHMAHCTAATSATESASLVKPTLDLPCQLASRRWWAANQDRPHRGPCLRWQADRQRQVQWLPRQQVR